MKANTNKAIEFLLARGNLPILYWLKKDILEVPVDREYKNLKKFALRIRILQSQMPNGGWCRKRYEGHPQWEKTHYIFDTLKNAFQLYNYACSREDAGIKKLVEFLFSTQTKEGDFRGAYLNEYAPTYHASILNILCLFGYDSDKRTQKAFRWLIKNRQEDGGWIIPCRTVDKKVLRKRYNYRDQLKLDPIKADISLPFSHLVTGMVLRALAESPTWRKKKETWKASELLISRFFKADKYEDSHEPSFWDEMNYTFWGTNILISLDFLSKIGFTTENEKIQQAIDWLLQKQNPQGYWRAGYRNSNLEDHLWVTFLVLRVIKNFGLLEL